MSMTSQLQLDLAPPRPRPRDTAPLERLHQILRRRNIDPDWRYKPFQRGVWILPLPALSGGDRGRIGPKPDRPGCPAYGAWETLCAWHVNAAQHCPERNRAYREPTRSAA